MPFNVDYSADFQLYLPLVDGLDVRPNIQCVLDPGGTSQNRNALVFGLKTMAKFSACLPG